MLGFLLVGAQLALIAILLMYSGSVLHSSWSIAGLIISGLWLLWAIWSMPRKTLKIHPSPAKEGVLCQQRAYHWVRHPMYGAVLLGTLMVAWTANTWFALTLWLVLIVVLWLKSSFEEKCLSERYKEYKNYKMHTPRWAPFGPVKSGSILLRWIGLLQYFSYIVLIAYLYWQVFENSWDDRIFKAKKNVNIRAVQAAELIQSNTNLLILDVRSQWEYSGQRLPGAVNISISDEEFNEKVKQALKGKSSVLIYCAGGYRSRQAVERLNEQKNLKPIYHLHRGMLEWWWR